jgi:hypothetical protein
MPDPSAKALEIREELLSSLSSPSIVSHEAPTRWSSKSAPQPLLVVNAETESDVAATVKYCAAKGIRFVAQNGGSGWAQSFDLGEDGILINLRKLNKVTFNEGKTEATIGGGSSVRDVITSAYEASTLVLTGNCNGVGVLGALLGGGYGNLLGLKGFVVDSIFSLRVVLADGELRDVTAESDPDLFWAMRGAGPNFGIATSAVVKAYPATEEDMTAWVGGLIFTPDKLEQVVQAVRDIAIRPEMNIFMYFISSGPPNNDPVILVATFLHRGTPEEGRAAYSKFYDIGPIVDTTAVTRYDDWNTGADAFCTPGARKPAYGVGFDKMIPSVWREVWDEYVRFQKRPTAENSIVLVEAYPLGTARSIDPASAAFPHRNVDINAAIIPWYDDESLDTEAVATAKKIRGIIQGGSNLLQSACYVNFGSGDESLETIYGKSLPRLQELKKRYDPNNVFNQWFNLKEM